MINQTTKRILFLTCTLIAALSLTSNVAAASMQMITKQGDIDAAILNGFVYIKSQMNEDGGIRWMGESSSPGVTIRVVQALAAAGYPQDYLISDYGLRPIDFLVMQGLSWVNQEESDTPGYSVARAGQLLTAVAAANENPQDFGVESSNLIFDLKVNYDLNTGIYGTATEENVLDQVWALIGLIANDAFVTQEAADWLASVQSEDGSWNDSYGNRLDTTPLAIMALVGSNHFTVESKTIQLAIDYLIENQKSIGGWQTEWDEITNANLTGMILQAISVMGQSPEYEIWQKSDGNPLTALLSIQQDNGVFGGEFANAYSTADAIIGVKGRSITSLGILQAASNAIDFLIDRQNSEGGWGNMGLTIDVMLALHAAGWQPNSVTVDDVTPLKYIESNLESYIKSGPDAIGKTMLGIAATGLNPKDLNGIDLSQRLFETYDETTATFGSAENTWHGAFAILALYASDMEIPKVVVNNLVGYQQEDGGWEYSTGVGSTPDSTSLVVQALHAAGFSKDDPVIEKALNYLKNTQTVDGGWGDSSTTSYALMALNLLDQSADSWQSNSGKCPVYNLLTYQKANGSFVYSWEFPDDNIMSTTFALMAFFGGDYLIQPNVSSKENYAAIVIDPGEGVTQAACIPFSGESISGLDLLQASGFDYQADQDGFVEHILNIENPDGETNYWSYWYWDGREWVFQNGGPSSSTVFPGTLEAWHFTSWEIFPSLPSEYIPDFFEICGEEVLTNFQQQPHIDYNDLFSSSLEKPQESNLTPENEIKEEGAPIDSRTPLTTKIPERITQGTAETSFPLPIVLIIALGTFTLGILFFLFIKYRK